MVSFGILSECWCTGGVERQVISLLKHLPSHIQCLGIGLTPGAPTDAATVIETGIYAPVFGTRMFSDTKRNDVLNVKRFEKHDEVLDRFRYADALLVWSNTRIPEWHRGAVVAVSHGAVDWTKRVLEACDERVTHRVAVSRIAAKAFPFHRQDQVEVIHNGVEFDRLGPTEDWRIARFEHGIGEDEVVVAYVGRFSEEKNPLAAARAVRALHQHGVRATAMYCGIGFDNGETRAKVLEITRGNARFLPVNDVVTAYTAATVVMCCSPLEGFGLTRLEAMACGVPLVCTRTGIIPEIEEQIGECCEIVNDPDNDAELCWAVLQAMQGARRAATARGFVWERFSARRMAKNWTRLLERIGGEVNGTPDADARSCFSRRGHQRA